MTNTNLEKIVQERKIRCEELFRDFSDAASINEENLKIILEDNKNTEFGKHNGFSEIKSSNDYSLSIPLSEYSDYENFAENIEHYTVYPIHEILTTSGSTGAQKLFPISKVAFERYSTYVHDMPYYLAAAEGKSIHMSIFRSGENKINILSSAYFRWLHNSGLVDFDMFAGGSELSITDEIRDVPYVKAWLMFSCPELEAIQSIYLYDIAMLMAWIEDNWRDLLYDMRNRTVTADVGEKEKKALLRNIPSEEWLDELETLLVEGFDEPILPRVWKNMKFVCGVGGKMYALQEAQIKKYLGDVPVYQFSYALSECIIAPAVEFGPAYYAILPRSAYYEFITEDGNDVVPMQNLKLGDTYELVLTTFSGLYRYKTGDLIHIVRFEGEAPVFEMVGKRQQVISVAGEKIDVYQATSIINNWSEHYKLETINFALSINTEKAPNGYTLFIEDPEFDELEDGAVYLDKLFRESSPDYDDVRNLKLLSAPVIKRVPYHSIEESQRKLNKLAHSKPQIFLNEERTKYLNKRVI